MASARYAPGGRVQPATRAALAGQFETVRAQSLALCEGLTAAGFPNIFIPALDSFLQVAEIPVLGTGKLDLNGLKQMAQESGTILDRCFTHHNHFVRRAIVIDQKSANQRFTRAGRADDQ